MCIRDRLLIDKNQLFVKDYKEILMMDQNLFKIQMDQYCLCVRGEKLEIYYYDQNEIRLNGHVKVIRCV